MSEKFEGLSENAKMIAWCIGYTGACIGICYLMYKAVAVMFGKAGVVTVL